MNRPEQIARVRPYVRDMADRMCLKDWRIEVLEDTPDDKGCNAEIETISGYKTARIRLALDFFENDDEHRRYILCHELVHLHLSLVDDFLRPIMGGSQQTTYDLLRERAVDEMAHALAPHMPMPDDGPPSASASRGKGRGKK